jgi:hypothetical protein
MSSAVRISVRSPQAPASSASAACLSAADSAGPGEDSVTMPILAGRTQNSGPASVLTGMDDSMIVMVGMRGEDLLPGRQEVRQATNTTFMLRS